MAPLESKNDNFTYEDLVDEISAFLEANKDISELEFECLLDEAFNTGKENARSFEKLQSAAKKKTSEKVNKSWFPKYFFLLLLIVFPGIVAVSYASNQSPPREVYNLVATYFDLPPYLDLYYYLYLRPIRMISIILGIPKLNALPECYLPNPFATAEEVPEMFADECKCPNTKYILATPLNSTQREGSVNLAADFLADQPVLLKKWGTETSLQSMRNVLKRSGLLLSELPNTVTSNNGNVSSMKQLTDIETFDTITKNTSLHLEWLTDHYIGCSAIKELLPLHYLVKDHYFDTARILLMDGAKSDAFELNQPRLTYTTAYIQGAGSRKIYLHPKYPCENRCRILSARLDAGDILLFSQSCYSARSEHVDQSLSLASVVALDDGNSEFSPSP